MPRGAQGTVATCGAIFEPPTREWGGKQGGDYETVRGRDVTKKKMRKNRAMEAQRCTDTAVFYSPPHSGWASLCTPLPTD